MRPATRCLILLASGFLFLGCASQHVPKALDLQRRQVTIIPPPQTGTATTAATTVATEPKTTIVPPTTSTTTTSSTPTTTSSSTSSTPTTTSTTAARTTSSNTPGTTISDFITTNSLGQTSTVIQTLTAGSPSPSQTSQAANSDSGLGTGSVIGLSVAGGVALLGIIGFFIWKFTRKRFSDLDDNEAIKWPEFNNHGADGHALPVNNTGRAGFDTGSEADMPRSDSRMGGGYAPSLGANSTPDLAGANADPYAVPPLPHLNPAQPQPYLDDPAGGVASASPYYDPYRGPVPGTLADNASLEGNAPAAGYGYGDAIPMTQLPPGRTRSPGPAAAYEGVVGRRSPGPQAGRMSPGALGALGGNAGMMERSNSPGGPVAGRQSPGPYGAGRQSPGPYGAYGGR